jgi:hypothetical protein
MNGAAPVIRHARSPRLTLGLLWSVTLGACSSTARHTSTTGDTSFAATQMRGRSVMGVDQYTSTHVFEDLPDGGRIVLDRDDTTDTAGVSAIRAHMREIATAFQKGDFTKPFQVHAQTVPGTEVMTARRALLSYEAVDRPLGAEVRIRTNDSAAVAAVHAFLAFQRSAHHAAGHEGMAAPGH